TKATQPPTSRPPDTSTPSVKPPAPGVKVVSEGARANLSLAELQDELTRLEQELTAGRRVRVSLSWVVETDAGAGSEA
ncbi:MAG: hypothetical protein ACO1SX_19730, partial [Actinomycetota bacterium]